MRGRTPSGPECVDRLPGSEFAKGRAKAVFETIGGDCRVSEACERLNICEQRFHQLRQRAVQAVIDEMESRAPGRRAQTTSPADEEKQQLREENQRLREELAAKDAELRISRVREEVALILPRVAPSAAAPSAVPTLPTPSTTEPSSPDGLEKKATSQAPSRSQEPRPNRPPLRSRWSMRKTRGKKKSM
jgi:hypothetical protein